MLKPDAILSDLDGTLLQGEAQTVSRESMSLIEDVLDAGIPFVPASGRQYANLRNIFAPIKDHVSYICENGCLAFSGGKLVSRSVMETADAHDLLDAMFAIDGAEVLVSGAETAYVLAGHDDFFHLMQDVVGFTVTTIDDLRQSPEPYFKISYYAGNKTVDDSGFRAAFGDRFQIVTGGRDWVDVMPKGTSKATAIHDLLPYLGADIRNTVAFGDEENDIQMMKAVGHPIAMDNAIDAVKEVSEGTTKTVDDALRKILAGKPLTK